MNFLLIQERGRHEANEDFREALSLHKALQSLGHRSSVWGLGYGTFLVQPIESFWGDYDAIILIEQYDQTGWVPDISRFNGPRVFWTVDSHCNMAEHQAQVQRQKITHLLSSTRDLLDEYQVPGMIKAWFPNCYDDTLIQPMPEVPKTTPIGFCGNLNNRGPWLDHLEGFFPGMVKRDIFVIGQDMVRAINSYKIHFNRNISVDLNYRTFETLGCRTMLMTNYTDGLADLFDIGRELVVYDSPEDLLAKTRYYLEHDAEREAIAEAGYKRVKRDHTYKERAKLLCRILGST